MAHLTKIRNPGSAITHFIGLLFALIAFIPAVYKASVCAGTTGIIAMSVFMSGMVLLYAASTVYHSVNTVNSRLKIFKRIDHMMIFVLIAATYTPVCLLVLQPFSGKVLLIVIWAIAAVGIIVKLFWIMCPKWFSSIIYVAMGWACLSVFNELINSMSHTAFGWLLAGGIFYTIGAVIYALKPPVFNQIHKNFGTHEIFHLFVMAGSACHFICIYRYVL